MNNDWQPIETAPLDGTPILAARQAMDDMVVASYQVGRWMLYAGWPLRPDAPLTHWMPLPDSPKVEAPPEQPRLMAQLRASLQLNDTGE